MKIWTKIQTIAALAIAGSIFQLNSNANSPDFRGSQFRLTVQAK